MVEVDYGVFRHLDKIRTGQPVGKVGQPLPGRQYTRRGEN
jgi:hypothetical protein